MREEGRGKRDVFYSLFSSDLCLSVLIRGSMPALPCTITVHGLPHFSQYGFTECLRKKGEENDRYRADLTPRQ